MDRDFWLERWRNHETGFHQARFNPTLTANWHRVGAPAGAPVFVPLCGKSLDMVWLAGHGHPVVGVELSEIAIDEFFASLALNPEIHSEGSFIVKSAGPYEIWIGDFFDLPAKAVARARAVYDRASLIALPPKMRQDYARHLTALTAPVGAPTFLIALEYDESKADGPPHAVAHREVEDLYARGHDIEEFLRETKPTDIPRFAAAGIETIVEAAYILRPRTV